MMLRKSLFWIVIGLALAIGISLPVARAQQRARQAKQGGLEVLTLRGGGTAGGVEVVAARIDPARWTITVVDRHGEEPGAGARAEEACPARGAAINASFFDENVAPLGLLIVGGKQLHPVHPVRGWPGGGGIFLIRNGRPSIIAHTARVPAGAGYAVQCWPRLIIHGKIPAFKQSRAAVRSAVGIDAQGRVLFVASKTSANFDTWAKILRDQLHCVEALNLDGGPSTQLAVRGPADVTVPGGWPVPVLITAEAKR